MAPSKDPRAALRAWVLGAPPPGPSGPVAPAALGRCAREQGLAGLLHAAVAGDPDWPPHERQDLANAHRQQLARGVRQLALAARVLARLEDAGLRALPLKGAALAEHLYDSVGDRPMADVDLLLLDDARQAARLLLADGFVLDDEADHAACWRDPASGERVELHHSATSCPGFFPAEPEALWARRQRRVGLVPVAPAPADLLLLLALHAAFQHGLVLSLVQWLDFRRLLQREAPPAEELLAAAETARALPALALALAAAQLAVGAPLPAALADGLQRRLTRGQRLLLARLRREPLALLAGSPQRLLRARWALAEGRRLALLRATLLPETPRAGEAPALLRAVGRALGLGRRWLLGPIARRLAPQRDDALATAPGAPAAAAAEGYPAGSAPSLWRGLLAEFPCVQLAVRGDCMRPALPEGSTLLLESAQRHPPRWGDVVLVELPAGLRLHRVVWPARARSRTIRTKGDRSAYLDPPVARARVLATAAAPFARSRLAVLRSLASAAATRALALRHGVWERGPNACAEPGTPRGAR